MLYDNKKLQVGIIIALGLLVYLNSLSVPFILDDYTSIVNVPLIKNLSFFTDLESARGYKGYGGFVSRYFGYLTFALNYRVGGLNVFGYHLVNIGIHILAALLVYRLVLLTVRTPSFASPGGDDLLQRKAAFTALVAALLFVLHPLQTQAVTYLVQRFASLAAMLYLLCLTNYVKGRLVRRDPGSSRLPAICWFLAALAAGVLAVKTKETSYTLPFAILLYEIVFFGLRTSRKVFGALVAGAVVAASGAACFLLSSSGKPLLAKLDAATRLQTDMSRIDYLATQCRVLVTYLRLLVFPVGQHLDYDFPVSAGFFHLPVLLSLALLVALFALGLFSLNRSGKGDGRQADDALLYRLIAFGVFWFFITISIESSFIPIVDVIFEHRMYLPSAGIFMAAAALVSILGKREGADAGWPERRWLAAVAGVLVLFGGATVARNQLWSDEVAFWSDNAEKEPVKARVFLNLGRAQERRGDLAGAEKSYRTANTLDPGLTDPLVNLGLLYTQAGRLDLAIEKFRAVLAIDPRQAEAHNNIGKIYGMRMQLDDALKEFLQAAELKPNLAEPYNNIGFVYALRKNYGEALKAYQQSLDRDPDYIQAYVNRGMALVATGRRGEARNDFQRALEINPGCAEAAEQLKLL